MFIALRLLKGAVDKSDKDKTRLVLYDLSSTMGRKQECNGHFITCVCQTLARLHPSTYFSMNNSLTENIAFVVTQSTT